MTSALIVVAKRPEPGQTKTRLCPPLQPEQAADLYECFLRDTLDIVRKVPDITRVLNYLPVDETEYFAGMAPDFEQLPQMGASLGERLNYALSFYLNNNYERAVIMNSDSPTLPPGHVARAFVALDEADIVLGPSDDGGYYLIGLKAPCPRLLLDVQMSTPRVLEDTLALAREQGLSATLLPTWYDIDTVDSLHRLRQDLQHTANKATFTRQWLNRQVLP